MDYLSVYGAATAGVIIGFILSGVFASGNQSDHDRCADALATLRARGEAAVPHPAG